MCYTGVIPGIAGSLGRFTLESIRDFLGFERIFTILARGYLLEHLTTLVAYYKANKPEDSDWVVLPASSFNSFFGSTVFSKQVLKDITDTVILRSDTSYGSGRFKVKEEYL